MANSPGPGLHRNARRPSGTARAGQIGFVVAAMLAVGQTALPTDDPVRIAARNRVPTAQLGVGELPLIALTPDVMPISNDEAISRNKLRPVDIATFVAARPFIIAHAAQSDPHYAAALQCLTQAVYYEAGYEPSAGMRAVAQVVLNRLRHPAFPNSVCGVVYQGTDRSTGCQFTFTCDGSLRRVPASEAWRRARLVAIAALNGWVEPAVGLATNYHADYVVPYWAGSLKKMATIGRHIFYGNAALSRAVFTQPYAYDLESTPWPAPADTATDAADDQMPQVITAQSGGGRGDSEDLQAGTGKLGAVPGGQLPQRNGQLEADRNRGELIAGKTRPQLLRD